MVTRSSESDSASSSWSARSADEGTEDERSPVPSPSASTHSGEYESVLPGCSSTLQSSSISPSNQRLFKVTQEFETRKLAKKSAECEELAYRSQELLNIDATSVHDSSDNINNSKTQDKDNKCKFTLPAFYSSSSSPSSISGFEFLF